MKILSLSAVLIGAGLLIAAPAFAQTKSDHNNRKSAQTTTEQRSHGGSAGDATSASPQASKQRTDGGPSDGGFYTGPASRAVPKQQ